MRLIYCVCAGFGQISRSFSFNSPHYSPQTIEKSASNRPNLVTITHLGPPPGLRQKLKEKHGKRLVVWSQYTYSKWEYAS